MKTKISNSLLLPLLFQTGFFSMYGSEEELAESIVYLLSEEMDALLDDDDIREMSADNMASVVGGVLIAVGGYNVRVQTSTTDYGFNWPHYSVWFSFTTSPYRTLRHTDYINVSLSR